MDHSTMKLGKLAPRPEPVRLFLSDFLTGALPAAPKSLERSDKVSDWGMMLNDSIGDCAIAGPGHIIKLMTAVCGCEAQPTDQQIPAAYEAVSGYKPGDEASDTGCILADVLDYWQGQGIADHKITAHAPIHHHVRENVRLGIDLFGALDIGLAPPVSAQTQEL